MPASITVNKLDLIMKIQEERDKHKAIYDEAVGVYRARFIEEATRFAEDSLVKAARGEKFAQFMWLPVPEEHTEDFDRAIEMLRWEVAEEVTLSEHDFATLVQNQWGWAKSFASNTTSYTPGR
jgi:hypothetical protein